MQDQTELLIEFVRKEPILYDMRHKDYKREDKKNKIREDIATEITKCCGTVVTGLFSDFF